MSAAYPPLRLGLLAATAVVAATVLTGCFANPVEDLVNQGIEGAVEEATGGDVSLGGELPADLPAEVPLPEGEVVFAAGTAGEGWVVTMTSSAADPVAEATAALEAAGFTVDTALSGTDAGASVYSNEQYLVVVAGDGENIAFTVTAKPQ